MRNDPALAGSCRLPIIILAVVAAALAGCSNSTRLSDGPKWSLTGGKDAAPPPPAQPPVAYRGGRDPVSGRAPSYGQGSFGQGNNQVASVSLPPAGEQFAPGPRPYPAPVASYEARPLQQPDRLGSNTYGRRIVTVQSGDSLASIAQANRVSIASLMFANGLKDAYLSPGQQLVLPPR